LSNVRDSKLEATLAAIRPLDGSAMAAAASRQNMLTKPTGSLGRLEEISIRLAGIARACPPPAPMRRAVLVFAGDHGVVAQGVSAYPSEVTAQMVYNFLRGGAAINVLARQAGARVVVVDAGVAGDLEPHTDLVIGKIAKGTSDISRGPAMTRAQAEAGLLLGIRVAQEQIAAGLDILACGEMGIGNTTPASAILAALTGLSARSVTGPGTGVAGSALEHKIEVVETALKANPTDPTDGIALLSNLGGYEIAGICGAMLAAAAVGIPVVVDGFIATSAALVACVLAPTAREYMFAGHRSAEPGHDVALAHLGLTPLLDLQMRLGEGTGAVMAMVILEAAARTLAEMATFGEAGVSDR
jgi:nicotinate-nucleotide--dimethylbenzimidazole phosphoribosyltransferase